MSSSSPSRTPQKPAAPRQSAVPSSAGARPLAVALAARSQSPPRNTLSSAGGNTNDDIGLSSRRQVVLAKKPSSAAAAPPSSKAALDAEMQELKRRLAATNERLASPPRHEARTARPAAAPESPTAQVAAKCATPPPIHLQGARYTATPHTPMPQRITWDQFDDDPEVRQELDRLRQSQQRIDRRHQAWSKEWVRALREKELKARAAHPPSSPTRPPPATANIATVAAGGGDEPSPKPLSTMATDLPSPTVAKEEPTPAADDGKPPVRSQPLPPQPPLPPKTVPNGNASPRGLGANAHHTQEPSPVSATGTPSGSTPRNEGKPPLPPPSAGTAAAGLPSSGVTTKDDAPPTSRMVESEVRTFMTYTPAIAAEYVSSNSRSQSRTGVSNSRVGSTSRLGVSGSLQRRTSSIHPNNTAARMLGSLGLPDALDLVLPDPEDVIAQRDGDILGNQFVLKRDLFAAPFTRDAPAVMGGAPGFRLIPRFNIGAVSQAHLSGIRTILNEVSKAWDGPVVWVNLREEPVIYVNNRSYIVRQAGNPREPLATPGIKAARLEELETKLRSEVLRESHRFGGNVIVHKELPNEEVASQWECAGEDGVQTLSSAFASLTRNGYDVRYVRLPVTPHLGITRKQFDVLFDTCERHPLDPIIANCQTGRGRSTVAMLIATIVRFYQHNLHEKKLEINSYASLLHRDSNIAGLRVLAQLVTLLKQGQVHERRVSVLTELTGRSSNLCERIAVTLKTEVTTTGVALMSRYCHLVAFSAYCEERLVTKATSKNFSGWLKENKPLDRMLAGFESGATQEDMLHERAVTPMALSESMSARRDRTMGEVLLKGMGLVSYHPTSGVTAPISGVTALRQPAPNVPVFTCGVCTTQGRADVLQVACDMFPKAPCVDWIDVRGEPVVYIDDTVYTLTTIKTMFKEQLNSLHGTSKALEDIEVQLKADVLQEAGRNDGHIEVISANPATHEVELLQVRVNEVRTPREYSERIACTRPVKYHRVPFASGDRLNILSVHPMIDTAASSSVDSVAFIEDSTGGIRSTVALNIFLLGRLAQIGPLNTVCTEDAVRDALATDALAEYTSTPIAAAKCFGGDREEENMREQKHKTELAVAATLGQMLAAGAVLMATESVVALSGRGLEWNLLDRVNIHVANMTSEMGQKRVASTAKALSAATAYVHVYLSAVYIREVLQGTCRTRYEDWLESLPEIGIMLEKMRENPKQGLKFIEPQNLYLETKEGPVARRRGNVLTSNFGLKGDHFPGAIRKNMVPQIPGVPNYRKVPFVNVYGVGIPTATGIANLLRVLGAAPGPLELTDEHPTPDPRIRPTWPRTSLFHPNDEDERLATDGVVTPPVKGRVIWINMREEPLLFVSGRPFVLRDLANPYVNVELTGITPQKIEAIEEALRQDCLDDASKYNNQFLTHDEIQPAVMGGLWEPGNPDTIKTIRQIYDENVERGAQVTYVRLPVTDEQMPEIRDFDILIQALLPDIIAAVDYAEEGEALSLVFNCQMGRGRTTTGMVVACMLTGLVDPTFYEVLTARYPQLYPADATKYGNGNYTVVQDLMRILVDGRSSKLRLDLVLEACDTLQNLRTAIELFKNQFESPESSESARARAHHHGQHYLTRYFFLIVINSYLHEAWDPEARRLRCTFEDYMEPRDELRHLAGKCELK